MRKQTRDFECCDKQKNINLTLQYFSIYSIPNDFNNMLHQLIDTQINDLNAACEQTGISTRPTSLRLITSLYLIRYHGVDR